MKKILVFMIFIMTSLTMYFLVWWQPTEKNNQVINTSNVIETDNNMKDNTNVEKELDDSKKEQDKIEKDLKEEAKKIEEESKKAEEERAKKLEEEKENNKLIVKKINENMSIEDKKNVDKLLNGLSTIDLMKIEEGILSGDLNSVKALITERLLLEDSKLFFEIIGKYK